MNKKIKLIKNIKKFNTNSGRARKFGFASVASPTKGWTWLHA
jgi:hypothetical protein